jgi:hypothetical protein
MWQVVYIRILSFSYSSACQLAEDNPNPSSWSSDKPEKSTDFNTSQKTNLTRVSHPYVWIRSHLKWMVIHNWFTMLSSKTELRHLKQSENITSRKQNDIHQHQNYYRSTYFSYVYYVNDNTYTHCINSFFYTLFTYNTTKRDIMI